MLQGRRDTSLSTFSFSKEGARYVLEVVMGSSIAPKEVGLYFGKIIFFKIKFK